MAINLPWFPGGDPTAPEPELNLHRFFGDFYQTYDLVTYSYPINKSIFELRTATGSMAAYATNSNFFVDRYTPYRFKPSHDWTRKFIDWIIDWLQLDVEENYTLNYQNLGSIEYPLNVPLDSIVYYLTPSESYLVRGNVVNSFHWTRQTCIDGLFTPKSLILHNSLEVVTEEDSLDWSPVAKEVLLSENWSLKKAPSEQDIDQDGIEGIRRRIIGGYSYNSLGFQADSIVEKTGAIACVNEGNPPQISISAWGDTQDGFEEERNIIESNNSYDCNQTGASLLFVDEIGDLDSSLTGFTLPEPEFRVAWYIIITNTFANRYECERLITNQIPIGSAFQAFTYDRISPLDPADERDYYFYSKSANNNYWGHQEEQDFELGNKPRLYSEDPDDPDKPVVLSYFTVAGKDSQRIAAISRTLSQTETSDYLSRADEQTYFDCRDFTTRNYTPQLISVTTTTSSFRVTREATEDSPSLDLIINEFSLIESIWYKIEDGELEKRVPDSIRTKEIHAALEADFFGSGANFKQVIKPDGSEEEVPNTVARQIEATQEAIQGFNFPGSFQSYRLRATPDGVAQQDPANVNHLPALLYKIYEELALVLGPGAISDDAGDGFSRIEYQSIQDQIDDVLTNQSAQFGLTSSLSVETKRTLWILAQVLKAIGVPCEVQELELTGLGKVAVPRVSDSARSIRQSIDDIQLNLTPKI